MTQEEKAKRYNEALEIAKKNYITAQDLCEGSQIGVECFKNTLENIFPELKESENKRILKDIIALLHFGLTDGSSVAPGCMTTKEQAIAWLEKQCEDKEINKFDVLPGLYKCVHRMFDGTPDSKLLFEVGNIYKCLSKHDIAEFEVSYGHSVYLQDPVVCKHFIPFENQSESNTYSMKETVWNNEDEENMNNVLYILNQLKDTSSYEEDNIGEKTINWFKSLKDRLCSNNEYDKDMLGAIVYCIKNNRPFEKEHIAWIEKQNENHKVNL